MALPLLDKDIAYISKLDTYPNDVGGMSAEELKAAFDAASLDIQNYINRLLIPQIESDIDAASQGVSSGEGLNGSKLVENSVADSKIINLNGNKIDNGTIGTEKHENGSITRELLSDDAKIVQTEDLPNNVVPGRALADNSIPHTKYANGSITTPKYADGSITTPKYADGSMTAEKVNADSRTQYLPATLPLNWTATSAPYDNQIDVPGLLPDDETTTVSVSASVINTEVLDTFNSFKVIKKKGVLIYRAETVPVFDIPIDITQTFSVETSSEWTGDAAPFTQEIEIEGLMATVVPDLEYESEAITSIVVDEGKIIISASEAIEEPVSIVITQVRFMTILSDEWNPISAPFIQTIAIDGLLENDRPKVFFTPPAEFADLALQQSAFAMLYDVDAETNSATFWAKGNPNVAFTVTLEVSRI